MGRNATLAAVAIALLGFAAFRFTSTAGGPSLVPASFTSQGFCMACKQDCEFGHERDDRAPFNCPACSERAVYQWMYCLECDRQFIPELVYRSAEAELPQPKPFFACPACRCSSYTLFLPDDDNQKPIGKAKLPKWPPPRG